MSFVKRIISLTFTLASDKFQGTGSNTLTISGLRTSLKYTEIGGGASRGSASISVHGLTQSQMNTLSTYGMPPDQQHNNKVSVSAGDAQSGMSLLFEGSITSCEADYRDQANATLNVEAYCFQYEAIAPAPPLSYPGRVDAAIIMRNLANQLNLRLENSGVSVMLSNPYFCGSLIDQVQSCAKAANINYLLDSAQGCLAIWPKNQTRGGPMVEVGPTTGLVGYPTFQLNTVFFTTLFNPNLAVGTPIKLTSSLQPACGVFVPSTIETNLSAETPDGPWFQTVQAYTPGNYSLATKAA